METLRHYLNGLPTREQTLFAWRCGTTIGYLRKKLTPSGGRIGPEIAMAVERESRGHVRCEHMRPDIDWSSVRSRPRRPRAA